MSVKAPKHERDQPKSHSSAPGNAIVVQSQKTKLELWRSSLVRLYFDAPPHLFTLLLYGSIDTP